MNVQCLSCSSRYSVPDEKVQGRKVRIRCKRCSEPILIDGTHLGKARAGSTHPPSGRPEAAYIPAEVPRHKATSKKRTMVGMPSAMGNVLTQQGASLPRPGSTRPREAVSARIPQKTLLGGLGPAPQATLPAARSRRETMLGGTDAPEEPAAFEEPWTVAVTEDDQRELGTDQVVALYAAGAIDEGTYVWRDGMDDWCSPFEAPELRRALNAARIAPREPMDSDEGEGFDEDDETVVSSSPLAGRVNEAQNPGIWHEPGRIGDDGPSFEDVTVSMNERETEGLLKKARRADLGDDMPTRRADFTGRENPFGNAGTRNPAPLPAPRVEAFEFDDEEVTRAIATTHARAPLNETAPRSAPAPAFELSQRKSSSPPGPMAPTPYGSPGLPPADRAAAAPSLAPAPEPSGGVHSGRAAASASPGERAQTSVAFSLHALTRKNAGPSRPPPPRPNADLFSNRPNVHPPRNLPSGPVYATPSVEPLPAPHPSPALAPEIAPSPATVPTPFLLDDEIPEFRKKRFRWPLLAVLVLIGAIVVAFLSKQPPALWAKVYELSGGQFPSWPELAARDPVATPAETPKDSVAPAAAAKTDSSPAPPQTADAPEPSDSAAESATSPKPDQPATPPVATRAKSTQVKRAQQPNKEAASAPEDEEEDEQDDAADGSVDSPAKPALEEPEQTPEKSEPSEDGEDSDDSDDGKVALPEFDRSAAAEALGAAAASASTCRSVDGPTGRGRATVTFANSGRTTNANVSGAFAGTSVGECIVRLFRQAHVPAFSGPPVKVAKSFSVE